MGRTIVTNGDFAERHGAPKLLWADFYMAGELLSVTAATNLKTVSQCQLKQFMDADQISAITANVNKHPQISSQWYTRCTCRLQTSLITPKTSKENKLQSFSAEKLPLTVGLWVLGNLDCRFFSKTMFDLEALSAKTSSLTAVTAADDVELNQ